MEERHYPDIFTDYNRVSKVFSAGLSNEDHFLAQSIADKIQLLPPVGLRSPFHSALLAEIKCQLLRLTEHLAHGLLFPTSKAVIVAHAYTTVFL